jgi:hypothetical protein
MTPEQYEQAATYWTDKEAAAKRMPEDKLRHRIDSFLAGHNTVVLACGYDDFVRCTPLEYDWRDGALWIFSEGGLKFRALKHNKNVGAAVFEPYAGFGTLESAQITGTAEIINPQSDAFTEAAEAKGLPVETIDKMRGMLHLIKIVPTRIDYLNSALRKEGYDTRQWLEL